MSKIQLSDHFTLGRLVRFVIPSVIMMIFTSIYGVVDGICVSNYAGKTAFAAVNLIMPFPMIIGALGFMLGTGGSALTAIKLGEGKKELANQYFTLMVMATTVCGIVCSVLGIAFMSQIADWLGASRELKGYCVIYGRIVTAFMTVFMMQSLFQSFLVVAEKPKLGLYITVAAGVTNIVLDILFVGVFNGGVVGAALATGISQIVGGAIPLIYFLRENTSLLRLVKTGFDVKVLLNACTNGSSELMSNVSMSLVNMMYNYQLIRLVGPNGVAAYGVLMYVNFIFIAIFIGYSIGSAPIVGYNYGAKNSLELQNVRKISFCIITATGICMTALALSLANVLAGIFVGYDKALFELTRRGFIICSFAFLLMGFNIFSSSFFTALGNGKISALISFLRTLVFQLIAVFTLPIIFKTDGVWFSIVVAELLAVAVTFTCLLKYKKKYNY